MNNPLPGSSHSFSRKGEEMKSQSRNDSQQATRMLVAKDTTTTAAVWNCVLITAVGICALSITSTAQQTSPKTAKISDGTIVNVTLTADLSSETSHQNDPVHGTLTEDIKVGDVVVALKGAQVIGHVTAAEPKGRWGHSGSLAYSLDYVKAVDGSNIRLRANASQGGEQSKAALMLGLSGAFKHGKEIKVAKGTSLSAYIDGDHTVTLSPTDH
jgi:hypothetical protein